MLLSLVFAGTALGAVASSQITSPADQTYLQRDDNNPSDPANTFTVSGTVAGDGTATGNVDLLCYGGAVARIANNVAVSWTTGSSGSFSTQVTLSTSTAYEIQTCTLRAVPAGALPSSVSQFAGPRLGISEFATYSLTSGPNTGAPYDYYISASQFAGEGIYHSWSDGGVFGSYPLQPSSTGFASGESPFWGNDTYDALYTGGFTRPSVQVDGLDAYGSLSAEGICTLSCALTGFPAMNLSHSYDPSTGDLTITESEPIVKCVPDANAYPPSGTSCTSFASTGVTLTRTIRQNASGAQATVTDTYKSTDGNAHQLDLVSIQDAPLTTAGYDFPWVDGGTYKTHVAGDTEPGAPAAPATIYLNYDNGLADGDPSGAQAAITFSGAPDAFAFVAYGAEGNTHLTAHFARTVPAGGPLTLTQVFSTAFTKASAQTLAGQAQAALAMPSVAIATPASSATVTATPVTVSGTATAGADNGGLASVTVDGQPVTLNSGGTWSTQVALTPGVNTITAIATDGAGNKGQAQTTVTYTAGQGSPPPPPAPAAPHLVLTGSLRFARGSLLAPLACRQDGGDCRGRITIRYTETVSSIRHHKRQKHRLTLPLGSGGYSLRAGQGASIHVALNRTGRSLLRHRHHLRALIAITLSLPNGASQTIYTLPLTVRGK